VFCTDEISKLISDCFNFVIDKIRQAFDSAGICFQDALFHPTKKLVSWTPFKDALFCNWLRQPDRRVVFSENEIYICSKNEWKFSTIITTDKGRLFISYVMKQMESILRKLTKFKYKITANINMLGQETISRLQKAGLDIESIVNTATIEFYKEATKTVVEVDQASLDRIRLEALSTQEALIVEEKTDVAYPTQDQVELPKEDQDDFLEDSYLEPNEAEYISESNLWDSLKDALSDKELQALAIILQSDKSNFISIKEYADNSKIMLEVLLDVINEKAMDYIGDNIIDDDLTIYEDYQEQVKGMVE
jgi:hypothetical protein